MATKPKPKAAGKKTDSKAKPVVKIKSTPKIAKASVKSPKKGSVKASKTIPAKSPAKPSPALKVKPSSSKPVQPVKHIEKPASKQEPMLNKPKAMKPAAPLSTEPKTAPKVNLENKKLVNKTTTTKPVPPPTTNGKTRYSDAELAEFKKIIDDKLLTARQELNYLQEQIVEMNENNADIQGSDWFDDSSIHAEVELLNNMAIRQRQFIQNLDNALVRIENKTYGICMITGNLIDKKRLLLVPHATKSIEAKHIEQATMVPELNQVAPDERVLRRSAEGKGPKKPVTKKTKSKSSKEYDDDEGDDMIEAPIEELDGAFEGGDD
jgi:RNA polymerase-binding transcription factor DksA